MPDVIPEAMTYFTRYIDGRLFQLLAEKSEQTHIFLSGTALNTSAQEMKVFIGMNMMMSCLGVNIFFTLVYECNTYECVTPMLF